jgi:tyrosinase
VNVPAGAINSGGLEIVSSGGADNSATLSGGNLQVYAGGTGTGEVVDSGGNLQVGLPGAGAGGRLISATINSGGVEFVISGGAASGTTAHRTRHSRSPFPEPLITGRPLTLFCSMRRAAAEIAASGAIERTPGVAEGWKIRGRCNRVLAAVTPRRSRDKRWRGTLVNRSISWREASMRIHWTVIAGVAVALSMPAQAQQQTGLAAAADAIAWHRWYIFYFEQIIRSLSGAADFALPYWNYASDNGPSLQLPAQFQDPNNPLYEDLRGLGFYNPAGTGAQNLPMNEGGYLPFSATDYSPALSAASLFPSDDSANFADLPDPRYYVLGLTGRLEIQPHDNVHVNVGGLMSNVPVAAMDPVFFVHHCQIDRLWASWQGISNVDYNYDSSNTAPSEKDWTDRKFTFVDATNKLVEVTTAGQLDTTKMGYKYDSLAPRLPQVAAAAAAASPPQPRLTAMQCSGVRVGSQGARVTLVPAPGAAAAAANPAAPQPPATLVLNDVKLLRRPPAPLHVFLNLPEGATPDLTSPYHIGVLNFFNWDLGTGGPMHEMVGPGGQVTHMMTNSGEFRFSVGNILARQKAANLWNEGPITVIITTLGADRSLANTYVTIGSVQLVP